MNQSQLVSIELLKKHKQAVDIACEKHSVSSLFVFGSVLKSNFTIESDLDFLVNFKKVSLLEYADNYFDLKEELETIFKRKVDLVSEKALKNPYFIREIEKQKLLVYEG